MANYLSNPFKTSPVKSSINLPLLDKVMSMRQGKYDANKAQVDQTLALYQERLKGRRDIDNQYIASKLTDVRSSIDQAGDIDWSRSNNAEGVMNKIKSLTKDPVIMSAVLNKAKVDQYNMQVDEKRKKGDGSYDDTNYQFGLYRAGVDKYDRGEVNDIGQLNYIDYYDESKEFKEFSENLDKYADDIEKSIAGNDGYIYTQKGKRMTPTDIKNKIESLLSDKAKKQMEVNAWATYDQGATEEDKLNNVKSAFTQFKDNELEKVETLIKNTELEVKNGTVKQSSLDNLKDYYKKQKEGFNELLTKNQKEQMYTMMYKETKLNNFAQAFAFDNVSESVSSDATFVANARLNWDKEKELWDRDYKMQQLSVEKAKADLPDEAVQTKADPDFAPQGEEENWVDKQTEVITGYDNLLSQKSVEVLGTLDQNTQDLINERVKNSKGKLTVADALIDLGATSDKLISAKDYKDLSDARLKKAINQEKLTKYTEQVRKEAEKKIDSEELITDLYNNPDVKMVWRGTDGKERLYSTKEVLVNNGIIDTNGKIFKKLSAVPAIYKSLKASMYADQALSTGTPYGRWENIKKLAVELGEDPNKIIKKRTFKNANGQEIPTEYNYLDPSSKTWKFYSNAEKNKMYDTNDWFGGDNSFTELSTIKSYNREINSEEIKKKVGALLAKDATLSIGKVSMVSPKTDAFNKLSSLSGDVFDAEEGNSLKVSMIPTQPNMVRVTQLQKDGTKEVTLRIEDLPPSLLKEVNFQSSQQLITTKNLPDIKQPVRYGDISNRSGLKSVAETHFGGVQGVKLAEQTTKDGALSALFNIRPDITGTEDKPTEAGKLIKKVIDDNSLLVTLVKGTSNDAYPTIMRKQGSDENIIWQSIDWIDDRNVETALDRVKYTPQLIVNGWLSELIQTNKVSKLQEIYGQ